MTLSSSPAAAMHSRTSAKVTTHGGRSSGASWGESCGSGMEVSGREGPGTGSGRSTPGPWCRFLLAGSPGLLGLHRFPGGPPLVGTCLWCGWQGLRRTPGLAPNDPKEEVAGLVLFTTFLGGVDDWGEQVLLSTLLVLVVIVFFFYINFIQIKSHIISLLWEITSHDRFEQ